MKRCCSSATRWRHLPLANSFAHNHTRTQSIASQRDLAAAGGTSGGERSVGFRRATRIPPVSGTRSTAPREDCRRAAGALEGEGARTVHGEGGATLKNCTTSAGRKGPTLGAHKHDDAIACERRRSAGLRGVTSTLYGEEEGAWPVPGRVETRSAPTRRLRGFIAPTPAAASGGTFLSVGASIYLAHSETLSDDAGAPPGPLGPRQLASSTPSACLCTFVQSCRPG